MSHDRSNNPNEANPIKLHAGMIESVYYMALMLVAVIVLAPVVLMWPNRK